MKSQPSRSGGAIATAHFRGIQPAKQQPIAARTKSATAPKAKRLQAVKFAGIGGRGARTASRVPPTDTANPSADRIARQRAIDALWDTRWRANSRT